MVCVQNFHWPFFLLYVIKSINCWAFYLVVLQRTTWTWFGFGLYQCPCLAHAGCIGTDRSLLTGHDVLLLKQIARDLLHAVSHRHDNTWHGLWCISRWYWWLVTQRLQVICQSKQNEVGSNHQPPDYWHIRSSIEPLPCPWTKWLECIW